MEENIPRDLLKKVESKKKIRQYTYKKSGEIKRKKEGGNSIEKKKKEKERKRKTEKKRLREESVNVKNVKYR